MRPPLAPGTGLRWEGPVGHAERLSQEWLDIGLSTQPADRVSAERCLSAIYARIGRQRPQFTWVDSPAKALPLLSGLPTLDHLYR
jgi:hypothetical protein